MNTLVGCKTNRHKILTTTITILQLRGPEHLPYIIVFKIGKVKDGHEYGCAKNNHKQALASGVKKLNSDSIEHN